MRYGNVVGSRGSVIPLFRDQAASGELTVTDERMTRFWITLDQAVQFVADCFVAMSGGEVFVPKIPSTRVLDLAEAIAPGMPIRYTGIRPGEKLHESLITSEEARHTVDHGWCYVVEPEHAFWGTRGASRRHARWRRTSCTAAIATRSGSTSPSCASCSTTRAAPATAGDRRPPDEHRQSTGDRRRHADSLAFAAVRPPPARGQPTSRQW